MLPGEMSLVRARAEYAYDSHPASRPSECPEGADIEWEITLEGFEKRRNWREIGFEVSALQEFRLD